MLIIGIWTLTLIPGLYFWFRQMRENRIIDTYIGENGLSGSPVSKATALRVSDLVRSDFNCDEKTFVSIRMSSRSFLRQDTATLLEAREGFCGEGARVVVRMLDRLGFDATRITLYNRRLRSAHTLVSVVHDDHEFLVDSIRSSDRFNTLLREHDISTDHFNVLPYSDSVARRRALAEQEENEKKAQLLRSVTDRFWLYSYEAMPFSKFATRLGLNLRVFNFRRPSRVVSRLAEQPNALTAILFVAASISLLGLLYVAGLI